jgi:hypothetical protein
MEYLELANSCIKRNSQEKEAHWMTTEVIRILGKNVIWRGDWLGVSYFKDGTLSKLEIHKENEGANMDYLTSLEDPDAWDSLFGFLEGKFTRERWDLIQVQNWNYGDEGGVGVNIYLTKYNRNEDIDLDVNGNEDGLWPLKIQKKLIEQFEAASEKMILYVSTI